MSCLKSAINVLLERGLILSFLALLLGNQGAFGQAGSSKPLRFASGQHFSGGSASMSSKSVLPSTVLKLAESEQYLLWVELKAGKMHLLERNAFGGMETRQIIPVSIGKSGFGKMEEGDRKTPVGVYRLTSFLTDQQLDDFYGLGAFPLNYPNVLDRQHGRTGSGIWLHGLPKNADSRPLLDSDGCVVIANESLQELYQYIETGVTHIVLSDEPLTWTESRLTETRREGLEQAFSSWKVAWENKDNPVYLGFYAGDFSDFIRNKTQWDEYKTRVNNGKRWISVETSNVSFFTDLKQPDMVTIRYYQDYRSSNYNWRGWKEQLWRETDSGWQIVYEGNG